MRQWRVGTITLGLTLFIIGSGLVYSRINGFPAVDMLLQWWPLVFIALGAEVLARYYFNRDGEERMKYDFASIIIILLIVGSGMVLQIISETGLSDRLRKEIEAEYFTISLPMQEVPVPAGVNKIVINTSGIDIDVRTAPVQACTINPRASIKASSQAEALRITTQQNLVNTRIAGNILFIEASTGVFSLQSSAQSCDIVIPDGLFVEIESSSSTVKYTASGPANPLTIGGDSEVKLILPATANASVQILAEEGKEVPVSNLHWSTNIINADPEATQSVTAENSEEARKSPSSRAGYSPVIQYSVLLGNGANSIMLINNGSCEVYQQ